MTWVKLDDQFFRHPKARIAGRNGRELFLAGLCYCAAQLTDGFIPDAMTRPLLAEAEVPFATVAVLVAVGLWEPTEGGHRVHDFLEYQPSADRVKAEREAARIRKRRQRDDDGSHAVTDNGTHAGSSASPTTTRPVSQPTPRKTRSGWPPGGAEVFSKSLDSLVDQQFRDQVDHGVRIGNPTGWRRKVRETLAAEHQSRARDLLAKYDMNEDELVRALCGSQHALQAARPR